ncbi:MAG TPA: GspH/FimT family pseudopilin [Gemmatimonadaceae bacterium]|nr:GspH/FimT family pseudopilin [Gemmatimonadaceae bacterium]
MRARRGFSLMELIAVIVLTGLMALIAYPRIRAVQRRTSLTSARMQLKSYLATARMTALRRGSSARLVRVGNTVRVTVTIDTLGTQATIVRPFNFKQAYAVLLSGTTDSVVYTPRGVAQNLSATGEKFYISADSARVGAGRDSLCVTRLGLVLEGSCGI